MGEEQKPQAALGGAIRQLRERQGLTQEALADRAGVSREWLNFLEGGTKSPTWRTLKQITDGLGVRMIDLVALAEALERE